MSKNPKKSRKTTRGGVYNTKKRNGNNFFDPESYDISSIDHIRGEEDTGGEVSILAGKFKGVKIKTPGKGTHPMGARERNALFNMLGDKIHGAMVLDAYAGSGAIGIEAISRGAFKAYFLDSSYRVVKNLQATLFSIGAKFFDEPEDIFRHALIFCYTAKGFCADAGEMAKVFDIVVADPPYDNFVVEELDELAMSLVDGGTFILSHPGEAPEIKGLSLQETHKYAAAHISIYVK